MIICGQYAAAAAAVVVAIHLNWHLVRIHEAKAHARRPPIKRRQLCASSAAVGDVVRHGHRLVRCFSASGWIQSDSAPSVVDDVVWWSVIDGVLYQNPACAWVEVAMSKWFDLFDKSIGAWLLVILQNCAKSVLATEQHIYYLHHYGIFFTSLSARKKTCPTITDCCFLVIITFSKLENGESEQCIYF